MKSFFGVYNTVNELVDYVIKLREYGNLLLCIACAISLVLGVFIAFKKNRRAFVKVMLLAVLCELMRSWFVVSSIWAANEVPVGYNTSTLAHLGVFIFLSMQSVTITKPKIYGKDKVLSSFVPALVVLPIIGVITINSADATVLQKVVEIVFLLLISNCIYNSMRYIVGKNNANSVCLAFRKTNIIIVIYAFAAMLESYLLLTVSYTKPNVVAHIGIMLAFIIQIASVIALPLSANKEVK